MRFLIIIYDDESYIHIFPLGPAYIASVLRKEGIDVEIYNQDLHHYPDDHLTDYLNKNKFDVVGVGVIGGYYQKKKLKSLSHAINCSKSRPFYIIAGHGPSPEPKYFLSVTGADAVIIGEGEKTVINLLNALYQKKSLQTIKGIAFFENNQFYQNKREPLIKNLDSIPWPAYDLFPIEYYRLLRMPHTSRTDFVMSMISGRGCSFKCNFCYRMDGGLRLRSNEAIIEEMKYLQKKYRITYIFFNDELLMSGIERTESLCRDMIKEKIKIKWFCSGRLNFARQDLLKLMKEAGCVFISYGIEAMDDLALKNMNKSLTVKQIIRGIEATLDAGISPGYNIIFGNIGENLDTLKKGTEFLLQYDDAAQFRNIRPVTPYPGSELYNYAIEKGFLEDCKDFYENKHVNSDLLSVNFTDLSDDEYHQALYNANVRLINNYFETKRNLSLDDAKQLYLEKNKKFRGFRHT